MKIITLLRFLLLTCIISIISFQVQSQKYTSTSKKAIKHFEKAMYAMQLRLIDEATKEVNLAIKADKKFVEAYLLLSDISSAAGDINTEITALKEAIHIDAGFFVKAIYLLAEAEIAMGKYDDALVNYEKYLAIEKTDSMYMAYAEKGKRNCEFAKEAIKNPVAFDPKPLSKQVNTKYDEYWPTLTADDKFLVFTRLLPRDTNFITPKNTWQEDFYVSVKRDNQWSKAVDIGNVLNTSGNEGAQSISADGKTMVFTACDRSDGLGKCDLYISVRMGANWSKPANMGFPVNSMFWESQPSLSPDGRTLYFVSNRIPGKGKLDIWVTFLDANGRWTSPQNLGDSINTAFDETAPFMHPDGRTIYFSSNGWPGMGRADIYLSKKIDNHWSTPLNLGYPINTFADENGIVVNTKGQLAFFSSDRNQKNNRDIFDFPLHSKIKPNPVTYVEGIVADIETQNPLRARVELVELQSAQTVALTYSDKITGHYLACLPLKKNYALNATTPGYLFYSENFSLENYADSFPPFRLDIFLTPIKKGQSIVLKNIFFETDSYTLKPESNIELDKLVQFLTLNSGLKIQISGHTDNQGGEKHNMVLSDNRAKAVVDYLIQHSISSQRLTYKGYGYTKPIDTNSTKEGRALNRRTEFEIID